MIVLTVASDLNFPGLLKLKASLEQFGYQYHILNAPFVFGGQMPHIYEWAKAQPSNTGFLYTDAYDTVALGDCIEFNARLKYLHEQVEADMYISVEKACFPHPQLAEKYPPAPFDWKYVNGGGWITTTHFFCKLFEDGTYDKHKNDQLWLTHEFLSSIQHPASSIKLDTNCQIFQSIAFEGPDDFTYGERLINNKTGTEPIFIHGNGRTSMHKIYQLPVIASEPPKGGERGNPQPMKS